MKKIFKYSLMFAAALTFALGFTSCSDDNNDDNSGKTELFADNVLRQVNATYVNETVVPTYRNLANYNSQLVDALDEMKDDAGVSKACDAWKASRKWWEFSEAFLFGPAGDYSIDPHTDTWPFDRTQFDNYMAKFDPINNELDAATLREAIQTGQNLTGFHAVEYLIFREGQPRKYADMTANEIWFAKEAAADLYISSLKLVSAWGGEVSEPEQAMLDDAEFESKDYGSDFRAAGESGSSYSNVMLATRQIISGAQDIIGEVRDSKIGSPAWGEDVNYIESPHSYNSIQDFYDNIMSCKHALYGGCTVDGTTPSASSLLGICLTNDKTKAAAQLVMTEMENSLSKINSMKRPFVLYYTDQSALDAMDALANLDNALSDLDVILQEAQEAYK